MINKCSQSILTDSSCDFKLQLQTDNRQEDNLFQVRQKIEFQKNDKNFRIKKRYFQSQSNEIFKFEFMSLVYIEGVFGIIFRGLKLSFKELFLCFFFKRAFFSSFMKHKSCIT